MAIVQDGIALLGFGTSSDGTENVAGYIIGAITEGKEGAVVEVPDEHNNFVASICNHGVATNVTLQVVPKEATTVPDIGSKFAFDSQTNGAGVEFIVHNVEPVENQGDVVRWTLSGKIYPNIDTSTP